MSLSFESKPKIDEIVKEIDFLSKDIKEADMMENAMGEYGTAIFELVKEKLLKEPIVKQNAELVKEVDRLQKEVLKGNSIITFQNGKLQELTDEIDRLTKYNEKLKEARKNKLK